MELAHRAGRIASLKAINAQLRAIAPEEAWADANIESATDLDALQDAISTSLVEAHRAKDTKPDESAELRKRLEEASGADLKAVFEALSLAGKHLMHADRVNILMDEDPAEVSAALDQVDAATAGEAVANFKTAQELNAWLADNVDDPYQLADKMPSGRFKDAGVAVSADNSLVYRLKGGQLVYQALLDDADRILTAEDMDALIQSLQDGTLSLDAYKAAFKAFDKSRDSVIAGLQKKTKDQLTALVGKKAWGGAEKKDELIERVMAAFEQEFALRRQYGPTSFYYSAGAIAKHKADKRQALAEMVEATSADDLKAYADKIAENRRGLEVRAENFKQAIAAPKTFEDFVAYINAKKAEGLSFADARMTLSPEQRAEFDRLWATKTSGERKASAAHQKTEVRAAAQTVAGKIVETKHTRDGYDLFVVQPAERVDRDIYNQWNMTAKRLGGWYSAFKGNGAVPGFQFKEREKADAFLKFLGGNAEQAQEAVAARRDAFEDDRSQSAAERLTEMADRLEERADASLAQERKANTDRRARMAASAEAAANADKAMARTMRNIASAIESGTAQFLARVRQKVQVETLASMLRTARHDELAAKYPSYADQEKHRGAAPTGETADYVKFPTFTAYRSDLARLGRDLEAIDGAKLLGQRMLKVADDVTDAYLKFAKENLYKVSTFSTEGGGRAVFASRDDAERAIRRSGFRGKAMVLPIKRGENVVIMGPEMAREKGLWQGDPDKRITLNPDFAEEVVTKVRALNRNRERVAMPYVFDSASTDLARLKALGIETPAELRAALREFISLREAPAAPSRVKELECAMVGRRSDGLDFFPTPAGVADEMVDAADIQPGMRVLEPSAGMGHIAERIREAGFEPDVVEMSGDRRELLEAKGFNLVGRDFMDVTVTLAPEIKRSVLERLEADGSVRGDVLSSIRSVLDFYDRGDYNGAALMVERATRQAEFNPDALEAFDGVAASLRAAAAGAYDRIIMNPPFSDRRDAEHVQHAYSLLKPGGRLVAIMGEGVFFGQDRKAQDFRAWLDELGGTAEKLPEGTFLDPSLPVNTGVNARMVVIDKPASGETARADVDDAVSVLRASDPNPAATHRITHADADRLIRDFVAAFPGAPDIVVVARTDQLPAQVQQDASDQRAGNVKGVFNHRDGRVYVVTGNHRTRADLEATLLHEAIGHAGVRALFGPEFVQRLNQIFIALGGQAGLVRIMQRRGMNEQIQDYLRGVNAARNEETARRRQAVAEGRQLRSRLWTDAMAKAVLTEEVFAHIAESGNKSLRDKFLEIVGRIRQWLRDKGLAELADLGESDLLFLLARARTEMQQGDSRVMRDGVETGERELVSEDGRAVPKDDPDFANAMRLAHILGLEERAGATVFRDDDAEFRRWFGRSVVVDNDGNPLPLYHGSRHGRITKFKRAQHDETGLMGVALTPDRSTAQRYAENEDRHDFRSGQIASAVMTVHVASDRLPALGDFQAALREYYGRELYEISQDEIDAYAQREGIRAVDSSEIGEPGEIFVLDPDAIRLADDSGASDDIPAGWQIRPARNGDGFDAIDPAGGPLNRLPYPTRAAAAASAREFVGLAGGDIGPVAQPGAAAASSVAQTSETSVDRYSKGAARPRTSDAIDVDGVQRPRLNSEGRPIHSSDEGIRNFWRWFGDSRVVDGRGRPRVVYHGTNATFDTFDMARAEREDNWSFSSSREVAQTYQLQQIDPQKVWAAYQEATGRQRDALQDELDSFRDDDGNITIESAERWAEIANNDEPDIFARDLAQITGKRASHFYGETPHGQMVEAYLRLENPIERFYDRSANVKRQTAPAGTPDGYIDHDVMDTNNPGAARIFSTVYHVNSGEQIKSVDNAGTFDPASPSIMAQRKGLPQGIEVVRVSQATARWMGFDSLALQADYAALAKRHEEYYDSAEDVRRDVEFVLERPENWYPHADGRVTLVRAGEAGIPSVRIDFRREQDGGYRIGSVYVLGKRQMAHKMADKRELLESLGLGGQSPERLTVADFLDRSSAPRTLRNARPGESGDSRITSGTVADNAAHGLTPDQFRAALVERFGEDGVASLERQGLLNVAEPNPADPTPAWYDTDTGRAYFAPSLMADADAAVRAVIHEIGEHHGLESALGPRAWRTLKGRIAGLARAGKNDIAAAWAGVLDIYPEFAGKGYDTNPSAAVNDDRFMHEVIARIGEEAAGRKSSLWRDILAAVNRFLLKMGLSRQINKNELADLVAGSLKRVMAGEGPGGPSGGESMASRSPMKDVAANIRRGRDALTKALTEKTSVHRAMFRNGLGWVDFVWGDTGRVKPSGKTDGAMAMGLAHIIEARQRKDGATEREAIRFLDGLVEVLAQGREVRRRDLDGSTRAVIELGGAQAVLVRNAGSNSWLLTGWELNPDAAGAANDALGATHIRADSSDAKVGAGFDSRVPQAGDDGNNMASRPFDLRGYMGRATASSRTVEPEFAHDMTEAQKQALRKVGLIYDKQTFAGRVRDMFKDFGKKFVQGVFDQYAPLKEIDQHAYMLARMSTASDGGLEAMMMFGKPVLDADGALDVEISPEGGFMEAMRKLGGDHDRFFAWVAGKRATELKAQGKENLLTDEDLTVLADLDRGEMSDGTSRAQAFAEALKTLRAYNKATLDIAEKSGLIDGESRALWESEFYVPFYRVMEDGVAGPSIKSGLVGQYAFKKLKGGTQDINDLFTNTLTNWSHLLSASAKNRAALAAMKAAKDLGIVHEVEKGTKGAVKVMEKGEQRHFIIDDPYLMDAVASLEFVGFGPMMEPFRKFKRMLTLGVTIPPGFKIANLARDTVSAVGQNDIGYNPLKNLSQGWKATHQQSRTYASMLAGGGMFRFGTTLEGERAENAKRLIKSGIKDFQILDTPEKVKAVLRKWWSVYEDIGDRMENMNRAALYEQLRAKGLSHMEASFWARDMMDFSLQGKWTAVRMLAQTVPFLNARLQGLYKLGRAAMRDKRRFAYVAGAVSAVSVGLMLLQGDDEDWKRREDWDRNNYWWVKIGGVAFYIPKPFELGAIGTLAERTTELFLSDEMDGARYRRFLSDTFSHTFAMSPIPQLVKPLLDVYANQDSFTGRAIETMGMERLKKEDRAGAHTTGVARLLGQIGIPDLAQLAQGRYEALSPVQMDHLIRGYFGTLGTGAAVTLDVMLRPVMGLPELPDRGLYGVPVAGRFIRDAESPNSRYLTEFYEQARKLEQLYATYQDAVKRGDTDKAAKMLREDGDEIRARKDVAKIKRQVGDLNREAARIRDDRRMSGEEKQAAILRIRRQQEQLAKQL